MSDSEKIMIRSEAMKRVGVVMVTGIFALIPLQTFAAFEGLRGFLFSIIDLLGMLLPLIISVTVLVYFFGLVKVIYKSKDGPQAVENGKRHMVWGFIAIFVLLTLWGIVVFIQQIVGIPASQVTPTSGGNNSLEGDFYNADDQWDEYQEYDPTLDFPDGPINS